MKTSRSDADGFARVFKGATLKLLQDFGGQSIEGMVFERCCWDNCSLSAGLDSSKRSTVQRVRLANCEVEHCYCGAAFFDDVVVDGLKTHGLFQCFGAAFRHVVLKGRIGRLMLSSDVVARTPEQQAGFDKTSEEFYRSVDWALDISEANFAEFDSSRLRIPSRLIRRDPETQVVVTREKALLADLKRLGTETTYWAMGIELFLGGGAPDVVFAAEKGSRRFKEQLAGLRFLRREGIAEPE